MNAKVYCLRVRYNPTMPRLLSRVRLTGWKESGLTRWKAIGLGMPVALKGLLRPTITKSGWAVGAKLQDPLRHQLIAGSRTGSIATTAPLPDVAPETVISPVMRYRHANTARRCREALEHYSKAARPLITMPPEPSDYFEQVQAGSRPFWVPRLGPDGWAATWYVRTCCTDPDWRVTVERLESPETASIVTQWSSDGDPLKAREAWLQARESVSFAWAESLGKLEYGLWCFQNEADPLNQFPVYGPNRERTTMTFEMALSMAKTGSSRLWHLENFQERSWDWI